MAAPAFEHALRTDKRATGSIRAGIPARWITDTWITALPEGASNRQRLAYFRLIPEGQRFKSSPRNQRDPRFSNAGLLLARLAQLHQRCKLAAKLGAYLIDGFHTFDHALVDFFYVNKMLDVGGVVIFDDVNMPSIARLIAHVTTYPSYRVFKGTAMPRAPNPFVSLRRRLNRKGLSARHSRDNPTCIALQKLAPDARERNWHEDF